MNKVAEPFNWSNYQKTYNTAIDLVAQCVGYYRGINKPLKAIYLKPTYYDLFRAGLKVLTKSDLDPNTEMLFDGVKLMRGSRAQFEGITCEFFPTVKPEMN